MDALDREERLKFAARYGDRATFDALGGSDEQWGKWKPLDRGLMRNLRKAVV